jgi:hypothetical protein
MSDGCQSMDGTDHLKNPMRWSIRHRQVDLSGFPVEVTEIDIRPDEGNIYVHWRDIQTGTAHSGEVAGDE